MKKFIFIVSTVVIVLFSVFAFGCKKSDDQIVGKYYLVSVTANNGTVSKFFAAYDSDPTVTENSFVLEIKDNYKWKMNIMLPGISETEDGKWAIENGRYVLKEDKDDPVITVNFSDNRLTFNMSEDGYVMAVTLIKSV